MIAFEQVLPAPFRAADGWIVTGEDILGVRRDPSPAEREIIAAYRTQYTAAFGFAPWGLHYIEGLPDHGPVFLPPTAERSPEREE